MNAARVAKLLRELADELEGNNARTPQNDWVDQYHSPLGKRKHLDLVRQGMLKGRKPDRIHVYVRRAEIDAYLDKHPAKRPVAPAAKQGDEGPTKQAKSVGQLRAELGLVRVRQQA